MAKKKDSVALFEVIAQNRDKKSGMQLPSWAQPKREQSVESTAGEEQRPETPVAQTAPLPSPALPGRLTLSLGRGSAITVIAVILLAIVGAFFLGRTTAGKPAAPEAARAGSKDPGTGGGGAQPIERQDGLYYLVIQNTMGKSQAHREDATKIRSFCRRHGHACEVRQTRSGYWVVWSLEGFDRPDSQAAIDFARRIEALGEQYRAEGGDYDFRQRKGGRKDGPLDPYYVKYEK